MWNDIINIAISNGIFAALFVSLLVYALKDGNVREKKYQKTIETLANKLGIVEEIKQDVKDVKSLILFPKKGKNDNEKV